MPTEGGSPRPLAGAAHRFRRGVQPQRHQQPRGGGIASWPALASGDALIVRLPQPHGPLRRGSLGTLLLRGGCDGSQTRVGCFMPTLYRDPAE